VPPSMLSNALLTLAQTAPTSGSGETVQAADVLHMLAVSVALALPSLWLLHRLTRRDHRINDAPMRGSTLAPMHLLVVFALWQGSTVLVAQSLMFLGNAQASIAAGIVGQVLLIASAVWLGAKTFDLGVRQGMGLDARKPAKDTLKAVLLYFLAAPVVTLLSMTIRWLVPNLEIHEMLRQIVLQPVAWKVAIAFSAVVAAPLAEEIFFRGLLQSMLRKHMAPWPAIIVTSVVFGLIHLSVPDSVIPLMLFGAALGWAYENTGRLLTPILLHMVFNGVSVSAALMSGNG
jgi:membrane protease YdiL (CAAX protease family)